MATEDLFMYHRARAKGIGGEREVRSMLEEHAIPHHWNGYAEQRRPGKNADVETDEFAIEVKRYGKGAFLESWWTQAWAAAKEAQLRPAVVYRFDRQPWRMRLILEGMVADVLFADWCRHNARRRAA